MRRDRPTPRGESNRRGPRRCMFVRAVGVWRARLFLWGGVTDLSTFSTFSTFSSLEIRTQENFALPSRPVGPGSLRSQPCQDRRRTRRRVVPRHAIAIADLRPAHATPSVVIVLRLFVFSSDFSGRRRLPGPVRLTSHISERETRTRCAQKAECVCGDNGIRPSKPIYAAVYT